MIVQLSTQPVPTQDIKFQENFHNLHYNFHSTKYSSYNDQFQYIFMLRIFIQGGTRHNTKKRRNRMKNEIFIQNEGN